LLSQLKGALVAPFLSKTYCSELLFNTFTVNSVQ